MIPPVESLVKYDKPVLVSSSRDKEKAKGKKDTFGVDSKGKALQTEDILNAILPPRCAEGAARMRARGGWEHAGCSDAQGAARRGAQRAPVLYRHPHVYDPLLCVRPESGPRTANCGSSLCLRNRRRGRMPFLWGSV